MRRFIVVIAFNGFYVGESGCAPDVFIARFGQYLKVLRGAC